MDSSKFKIMLIMVVIAIILCLILWIIAIIGGMNLTHGCFYRYNFDSQGNLTTTDSVTDTAVLKGSANYTVKDSDEGNIVIDPSEYGRWLNTNLRAKNGQNIKFKISGEVSLCRAYVPSYNLQQDSDLDVEGNRIPIPRVEELADPPVSLIFNAKNPNWSNLTELYRNDEYYVAIQKDQKTTSSSISQYDFFLKDEITADCRDGSRTYDPICGRYSLWDGTTQYVSNCSLNLQCYRCNCRCYSRPFHLPYWPGDEQTCRRFSGDWDCDWCTCWQSVMATAPEPYEMNGSYTLGWVDDINKLGAVVGHNCASEQEYIRTTFQNQKFFWFSADEATGLVSRISDSLNPANKQNLSTGYSIAKVSSDQSFYNNSVNYKIIAHEIFNTQNVGYLQYKMGGADTTYDNNTGGYVLNIRQTKCRRSSGIGMDDVFQGRGSVEYVIIAYGHNPNTMTSEPMADGIIQVDSDGRGEITLPSNKEGYLWLRIKNDKNDYKDSVGQYNVDFSTEIGHGGFFQDVLNPLFEGLKSRIKDASITIFKNMTCYQGAGGAGSCTNFFNYIKGLLILYIMFYAMMFLLGMVQINQIDLVTRIVKIALVAGLMNGNTFEFFSQYVFNFVTNFSDNIIANMSGYSIAAGSTNVSNPFMFMNEVFTKFFLSSTFAAQIMALPSMGINGVIYFIIIFVCIGIVIITGFRAIAVYLMAYLAIAVLIGIAPLFLTFILFERTRYLFENWVRFTFRYMIEPTVMLAGIIILTQLFTIYLDYVIGYSVCWKCAIPFRLPFPSLPGFNPAFLNVDLFCFNWFAPWGYDHRSSSMGVNMTNVVVLLMLAYCMWGWIEFSGKIVARLAAGGSGGPSATGMGMNMASSIEQGALGKVGLDAQSRSAIKSEMKQRVSSINKGDGLSKRSLPEIKGGSGGIGDKKPLTQTAQAEKPTQGFSSGTNSQNNQIRPNQSSFGQGPKTAMQQPQQQGLQPQQSQEQRPQPQQPQQRPEQQQPQQPQKQENKPTPQEPSSQGSNAKDNQVRTNNESRDKPRRKQVGLGDRVKNFTPEQKKQLQEKFKRPALGSKANRRIEKDNKDENK